MIRWELLLLSISLTLVMLSTLTINTPNQITYNFLEKEINIPPLVQESYVTILQNKSGVISEVEVYGTIQTLFNVSSSNPVIISLYPGNYTFQVVKEYLFNTSSKKFVLINDTYNATLELKIVKVKLLLHDRLAYVIGVIGSVIGVVFYVYRVIKTRSI